MKVLRVDLRENQHPSQPHESSLASRRDVWKKSGKVLLYQGEGGVRQPLRPRGTGRPADSSAKSAESTTIRHT